MDLLGGLADPGEIFRPALDAGLARRVRAALFQKADPDSIGDVPRWTAAAAGGRRCEPVVASGRSIERPQGWGDCMASSGTGDSPAVRSLIGCGANLGCPREQLNQAIDMLRFMPGVELLEVSRFIETRPIGGPPGQPAYINAACLIETGFGPEELLDMLAAVEKTLDRRRGQRWGPRSIDLDLLLHGDEVAETDTLQLPHPRMMTRRFVLEPAAEIAADLVHPLARCTIGELLENISHRHLHVSVVGIPGSGCPEIAAAVADVSLARLLHAPTPLPLAAMPAGPVASPAFCWQETLERYAAPLRTANWPRDPHGTVTDYWLGTVQLAADRWLDQASRQALEPALNRLAKQTVPPHVVLFLEISRSVLEERLRYRSQGQRRSDLFDDLAGTASASAATTAVDTLLAFQNDLRAGVYGEASAVRPKAVIRLNADDLGQAAIEAVAAIEAAQ